jgi:hypothetical protein
LCILEFGKVLTNSLSMEGSEPGSQAGREGVGIVPLIAAVAFMALFRE